MRYTIPRSASHGKLEARPPLTRRGKLQFGTWQGIFFSEFDGPRTRKVWVTIVGQRSA